MAGEVSCDVVVLGAGFAGLMSARKLVRRGYRVALVERADRMLSGASGRNEGWLHAGTYHAVSIRHRPDALLVAARCLAGSREIMREFPDCVEPEPHPSVAVVRDTNVTDTLARWEDAGVGYRPAPARVLAALLPDVTMAEDEVAFVTEDRGIDIGVLGTRAARDFVGGGGRLLLGARPRAAAGAGALRLAGTTRSTLRYRYLVCATGFATARVCAELGLAPPPIRLWRSHLAALPRLAATSVFAVAPGEAAMVNHRGRSVVGLNEDARLIPHPTFAPAPEIVARLFRAIRARFPRARLDQARISACIKVDAITTTSARSLRPSTIPLAENALCVLPGKMTEAPIAADQVVTHVSEYLGSPRRDARSAVRAPAERPQSARESIE